MRKLIAFLIAIVMIASMSVTAFAATPTFKVPSVPQISDIKFDVKVELDDDFWDKWFDKNPIDWGSIFNKNAKELSRWNK